MRTRDTRARKTLPTLLGSLTLMAVAVVGAAALLLPTALAPPASQAPSWTLVDDAGGSGSQTPDTGPSHGPSSSSTPTGIPGNNPPGGSETKTDTSGEGGGTGMAFGTQTALSLGLLGLFGLLLIPGRRPPRSAGGRTGR